MAANAKQTATFTGLGRLGHIAALQRSSRLADGTPLHIRMDGAGLNTMDVPDGSVLVVATGEDYGGYNGPYNRAIVALDPLTLDILGSDQRGATGGDQDYGTTPVIFHDGQGRDLVGANHKNGTFYAFLLNNVSAGPIWQRATGTTVGMMPAYDPRYAKRPVPEPRPEYVKASKRAWWEDPIALGTPALSARAWPEMPS